MDDSPSNGASNGVSQPHLILVGGGILLAFGFAVASLLFFRTPIRTQVPTWSSQRPLFVDVDHDGRVDPVGRLVDYSRGTEHAAAFSGVTGEPLWTSAPLRSIGADGERLTLSLFDGHVRARLGDSDTWLQAEVGEPVRDPEGAPAAPDRKATASWPFPDESRILHSSVFFVKRGIVRPGPRHDFDGFERRQEVFTQGAAYLVSFGDLAGDDETPALVGYRFRPSASEEAWRVMLGEGSTEPARVPPNFTAIDGDRSSVVAVYRRGPGLTENLRAALVAIESGALLWDVPVPEDGPFCSVTLRPERVWVSTLGGLYALDRSGGSLLLEIAPHRF